RPRVGVRRAAGRSALSEPRAAPKEREGTDGGRAMTVGPGWYADPGAAGWWRWFDGASWTAHTHPMQQPAFGYGYAAPPPQRDRGLEMLVPVNRAPVAIVAGYLGIF